MSNDKPQGCPQSRIDNEYDFDNDFVSPEDSIRLRALGYDYPSLMGYSFNTGGIIAQAITYTQAFHWLRQVHGLYHVVMPHAWGSMHTHFWRKKGELWEPFLIFECVVVHESHEAAVKACLNALIRTVHEIMNTK